MDESRIKMLIDSYGLVYLLEDANCTEYQILSYLVKEGVLDIDHYFELDMEDEGD